MKVTHVRISVDVANRVLGYLATKPFNEVFELIGAMKGEADASFAEQQSEAASTSTEGS